MPIRGDVLRSEDSPRGSSHRQKLTYLCTFRLRAQGSNRWRQASLWTRTMSRRQSRADSLHTPFALKSRGLTRRAPHRAMKRVRSLIRGYDLRELRLCVSGLWPADCQKPLRVSRSLCPCQQVEQKHVGEVEGVTAAESTKPPIADVRTDDRMLQGPPCAAHASSAAEFGGVPRGGLLPAKPSDSEASMTKLNIAPARPAVLLPSARHLLLLPPQPALRLNLRGRDVNTDYRRDR